MNNENSIVKFFTGILKVLATLVALGFVIYWMEKIFKGLFLFVLGAVCLSVGTMICLKGDLDGLWSLAMGLMFVGLGIKWRLDANSAKITEPTPPLKRNKLEKIVLFVLALVSLIFLGVLLCYNFTPEVELTPFGAKAFHNP